MKKGLNFLLAILLLPFIGLVFSSFLKGDSTNGVTKFPYSVSSITERQAAAHLISRFSYGVTPGQIDAVLKEGLENWFNRQLNAVQADDSLSNMLASFDALQLTNEQVLDIYPKNGQLIRMAVRDGAINKDSVRSNRKEYRDTLLSYMNKHGLKPVNELYRQFINQKVLRAAYTNNQLREVMTDFWFNHFNVSITKGDCAEFIPAYERDVIRPNALGKFSDLLMATAKSPAMLYYLDNFSSSGDNAEKNKAGARKQQMNMARMSDTSAMMPMPAKKAKKGGLNENYAREVMELHTLGVDGGYTQQDVTQAARVLTGWTVYPIGNYGLLNRKKGIFNNLDDEALKNRGFVHDGDFLFNPNKHDNGEKVVLGKNFAAGGGYDEGVELLNILAHHQSTAKFISRKLAVRFVSDNPSPLLVNAMAKTFLASDGDIKKVLITMVSSKEFWSKASLREKTKSPFELAIGAVRVLNAKITQPYQLYNWINKMGEKKYYYQAPTGFPDRGQYWINTGSLLSRMNFGLALATGRIPGVKIDLIALNNHHEPESSVEALKIYGKLIMPERDLTQTIKRLTPLLNDPALVSKISAADASVKKTNPMQQQAEMTADTTLKMPVRKNKMQNNTGDTMLAQVVGVIVGSPEYQRR
ncbi:DUF1800 domain-containing protein [Mucilaginibacter gynuensis]|uniref:DUF1800 domain-containing protein n=1 Tax=Mucilaginibacter gynuensis TaxID=1302236 RepID=A0ABP8FYN3_9SPHI